jgi:hypothetical protein
VADGEESGVRHHSIVMRKLRCAEMTGAVRS